MGFPQEKKNFLRIYTLLLEHFHWYYDLCHE